MSSRVDVGEQQQRQGDGPNLDGSPGQPSTASQHQHDPGLFSAPSQHGIAVGALVLVGRTPPPAPTVCALADGQPAHRRPSHRALQPPARAQVGRQVGPAHRGHGPGAPPGWLLLSLRRAGRSTDRLLDRWWTRQTRLVPGAVDELRRSLEWAGLDYDEGAAGCPCPLEIPKYRLTLRASPCSPSAGPGAGGSSASYVQVSCITLPPGLPERAQRADPFLPSLPSLQSERLDLYHQHIKILLEVRLSPWLLPLPRF